jgi:uncharacterized delta-60 repeat protein
MMCSGFRRRLLAVMAITGALMLLCAESAGAAPGDPDGSFGTDGEAIFDFGDGEQAEALVQGPGGKLYVGGNVDAFFFSLRIKPGGDEDDGYGTGGWAGKLVGEFGAAHGMEVAADGSAFVVGGRVAGGLTRGAVVKFDPAGNPDPSFSGDGLAVVADGSSEVGLKDVVVQPDGKIVALGETASGGNADFLLVRLKPNGSLDQAFGQGGRVRTSFGPEADTTFGGGDGDTIVTTLGQGGCTDVAVQGDGKPVVAATLGGVDRFSAVRFLANGKLDKSFGDDGVAHAFTRAPIAGVLSAGVQGNGRIVVAGYVDFGNRDVAVARFLP